MIYCIMSSLVSQTEADFMKLINGIFFFSSISASSAKNLLSLANLIPRSLGFSFLLSPKCWLLFCTHTLVWNLGMLSDEPRPLEIPLTARDLCLPFSFLQRVAALSRNLFDTFWFWEIKSFAKFWQIPSVLFHMLKFVISIFFNNNWNYSSELQIRARQAKCTVYLRKISQTYNNSHDCGSCFIYVWFHLKVFNRSSNLFIGLERLSAILPRGCIQILDQLLHYYQFN